MRVSYSVWMLSSSNEPRKKTVDEYPDLHSWATAVHWQAREREVTESLRVGKCKGAAIQTVITWCRCFLLKNIADLTFNCGDEVVWWLRHPVAQTRHVRYEGDGRFPLIPQIHAAGCGVIMTAGRENRPLTAKCWCALRNSRTVPHSNGPSCAPGYTQNQKGRAFAKSGIPKRGKQIDMVVPAAAATATKSRLTPTPIP